MKQSKRRMQVAQRRAIRGKDILQRHTRRHNKWTYLEFIRHIELNHQWALPHMRLCLRRHKRIIREAQNANHWSMYRR
jgi:hypothetical protein